MPPTFAYAMARIVWLFIACVVWFVAGLLLLLPRTRSLARPFCLAMVGTFPCVFIYQVVVAPVVGAILLAAWALGKISEPGSITMALLSFGAMFCMPLAGFYEGWRIGWECGKGRPWREAIQEGQTAALLRRLLPTRFLGRWLIRAQG